VLDQGLPDDDIHVGRTGVMTPLSSQEGPVAGMVTNPPSEPVLPTAQQSSASTHATAVRLSSPLIGGLATSWKPAPESWAIAGEAAFASEPPCWPKVPTAQQSSSVTQVRPLTVNCPAAERLTTLHEPAAYSSSV
jgi:hypothetical protein